MPKLHAENKCPGCGKEFGHLTDHPQNERKCENCLAGVWAGGVPTFDYSRGRTTELAKQSFMNFLRSQAESGIQKAKNLLAQMEAKSGAVIEAGPLFSDEIRPHLADAMIRAVGQPAPSKTIPARGSRPPKKK